nr:translational initiation factor 1 [Plantago crassifolia]
MKKKKPRMKEGKPRMKEENLGMKEENLGMKEENLGMKESKTKEKTWVHEGLITESLPNGMFRVRLDNEDLIIGYISGKIRRSFIRILPGDKVQIEVSHYDSTRGRIIYRLQNEDSQE